MRIGEGRSFRNPLFTQLERLLPSGRLRGTLIRRSLPPVLDVPLWRRGSPLGRGAGPY
jgi:hypothetical protein